MKKVITLLCACSLLSSISTTVFAENIITNSEKITDAKEIYDIVAPFIEENYADSSFVSPCGLGDNSERCSSLPERKAHEGEHKLTESYKHQHSASKRNRQRHLCM